MRAALSLAAALLTLISSISAFDLDSLLIQSIGGPASMDSLKLIHNYRADGRVTLNGQQGDFTMYWAEPDRFYAEMRFTSFSMAQAYDGHTAWMRDFNGQYSDVGGFEKEEILEQIYLQSYSYLIDSRVPGSAAYRGLERRDGAVYHHILLIPLNNDTMHVYLDTADARPALITSKLDNVETRSVNSDFRTVAGVVMPFRTESEALGAPIHSVTQIDTLIVNDTFDYDIFSPRDSSVVDYHFPPDADSVIVPFEFVGGHIVVPVMINGKQTSKFILDSGASANFIDRALADKLQLTPTGSIAARGVAGFDQVALVRPDSIAVGDLVLYGQTAGRLDLSAVLSHGGEDTRGGMLGYDFLSRFPILIDYHHRQLRVYNPATFREPSGGVDIPFTLTSRVPTVTGSIDGVTGQLVVDLGNAYGLILHPHFVEASRLDTLLTDMRPLSGLLGGVGGALSGQSATLPRLEIGSLQLDTLPIIIPDSKIGLSGSESLAGNIGNRILSRFAVLFDYRADRIVLYSNER